MTHIYSDMTQMADTFTKYIFEHIPDQQFEVGVLDQPFDARPMTRFRFFQSSCVKGASGRTQWAASKWHRC
jgi:hypothetical protein